MWAACFSLICGAAQAQAIDNPLIGAWTGGSADGSTAGTDVYNADGTFVSTARVGNGMGAMLVRVFARYRARQIGQNQVQVDIQVAGYLPRQICSVGPGGTGCQPFSLPNLPTAMTVTFLDQDTIQANGIVSHRDDSPALSQMEVPQVVTVQAQNSGPAPTAMSTCTLGSTVCDPSGWRKFCERWPAGNTDWKQHGVRCRNGYGQPEF